MPTITKTTKRKGGHVTQTVIVNVSKGRRGAKAPTASKAVGMPQSSPAGAASLVQPVARPLGTSVGSEYAALTGVPYLAPILGRPMNVWNQPSEYEKELMMKERERSVQREVEKEKAWIDRIAAQIKGEQPVAKEEAIKMAVKPVIDIVQSRPLEVAGLVQKPLMVEKERIPWKTQYDLTLDRNMQSAISPQLPVQTFVEPKSMPIMKQRDQDYAVASIIQSQLPVQSFVEPKSMPKVMKQRDQDYAVASIIQSQLPVQSFVERKPLPIAPVLSKQEAQPMLTPEAPEVSAYVRSTSSLSEKAPEPIKIKRPMAIEPSISSREAMIPVAQTVLPEKTQRNVDYVIDVINMDPRKGGLPVKQKGQKPVEGYRDLKHLVENIDLKLDPKDRFKSVYDRKIEKGSVDEYRAYLNKYPLLATQAFNELGY